MRDRIANVLLVLVGLAAGLALMVVPQKFPRMSGQIVDRLFWGGVVISAAFTILALVLLFFPGRKPMDNKQGEPEVGDYNTLIGKVSMPKRMGHGNTIVGATDDRGNTILNKSMSVGYKAGSAPDSIIIGAFAGSNLGKKPVSEEKS
jgi:hypothetical protein